MAATTSKELRMAMRPKHYNRFCSMQNAAMKAALDLLPSFPDKHEITIVDYGCSQGANSLEPIQRVLSHLPSGASASLIFEDTPFNDFSTLCQTIDHHLPSLSSSNYGKGLDVFPSLVPVGFFKQVVPNASVDLGVSWSAFNYLQDTPSVTLDPTAPPSEFATARQKALSTAAHPDLVKLLELRAHEIKPGGYLVAAIGGQKPAAETTQGDSNPGAAPLQLAMMRLVATGKLSPAELAQWALWPSHERTPNEVRAVLESPSIAAVWEAEVVDAKLIVHPAWEDYQNEIRGPKDEKNERDAYQRYADAVIKGLVAASGWFWAETIRKSRGLEDKGWDGADALLGELTDLAIGEFVDKFKDMRTELWYNYVRLRRKSA